jgi:hypothetical protein
LKRIPSDGTAAGQAFLAFVFTGACDASRRSEIVDYVNKTYAVMPGGERTVKQAVERMDQCIARRKLVEPAIRTWLAGGKPNGKAVGQGGGKAGAVSARH